MNAAPTSIHNSRLPPVARQQLNIMEERVTPIDSLMNSHDVTFETTPLQSQGYWQNLKRDRDHRIKFLKTVCLCWSFLVLGWTCGQQGPSFIDLQLITNVDLKKGAMIFTASSTGYLFGSLLSGILYDLFNKLLLIFISILGIAVTVTPIPWCTSYGVMIAITFICCLFKGSLDTGGNAYCVQLWKKEGRPYMQAIHFSFALGGILSPLAVEPFLAPTILVPSPHSTLNTNHSNQSEAHSYPSNTTNTTGTSLKDLSNIYIPESNFSGFNSTEMIFVSGESSIHYAYILSGILVFSAAIPFFYFLIKSRMDKNKKKEKDEARTETGERHLILRIILVILVSSIFFTYVCAEESFFSFLAVFCVKHMGWSKSEGSFATSTFWATFGTGRLIGIFIIRFVSPVKMLFIFLTILVLSFVGIILTALMKVKVWFWACVAICGFGMSIIFPTVFSWTEEKLFPVSGKTASAFLVFSAAGGMVSPVVLGHLMEEYDTMWFPYVLFGESLACAVLFLVVFTMSRNCIGEKFIRHRKVEFEIHLDENTAVGEKLAGTGTEENNVNVETTDILQMKPM
ncbi:hypothetical protein ScPMuIL_015569 [Solemya velum]